MFAIHFNNPALGRSSIDELSGEEFAVVDGQLINAYGASVPVDENLTISGPLTVDGSQARFELVTVENGILIGHTSPNFAFSINIPLPSPLYLRSAHA